ncbi:hypothetical protein GCM10010464_04150 [Pseudonocardia yunnanensis]|uniref:Uncharacterized protein n=1 Tax=Pseudonocardia yunnanensis TaxID=58107 RepID=A0ABW4EVF8_9PSEU
MSETLQQQAVAVLENSRRVRAHRTALQDAQRLRERTGQLKSALAAAGAAAQQWDVYREEGLAVNALPQLEPLVAALASLRAMLGPDSSPPDEVFVDLRNALAGLQHQLRARLDEAWRSHTTSRVNQAGLASVHLLPPASRQALDSTMNRIDAATNAPPTTLEGIRSFNRLVAEVAQRLEATRVRELPPHLSALLREVNGGGLPLSELTEQDLRELKERGFDRHLQVRWATA